MKACPQDALLRIRAVTEKGLIMQTVRDPLVAYNERVKLFANFMNATALGLIGFAVLRPLTESLSNASLSTLWWGATGLAMHGVSHYVLGRIRKEVKE